MKRENRDFRPRASTTNRSVRSFPSTVSERTGAPAPLLVVYQAKRQRTLQLVRAAVDVLLADDKRVSIASITAKTKALDTEGKGVSKDGLLGNDEARAYYEEHRTTLPALRRGSPSHTHQALADVAQLLDTGRVRPNRDQARVRQRYQRLAKRDLIDRLLNVERAYAAEHERWLQANDLVFWWMHVYCCAMEHINENPVAQLP